MVSAIINSGPREDSTRIGRAGTVRRQAVDVSPLRRVNQSLWLLCTGAREAAFRNIKSIAECLADELINAAKVSCEIFIFFESLRVQSDTAVLYLYLHGSFVGQINFVYCAFFANWIYPFFRNCFKLKM